MIRLLSLLSAGIALACCVGAAHGAIAPERALLIVNTLSEESSSVAEEYARRRSIPAENRCPIQVAEGFSVDRATYRVAIEGPIAACLQSRNLQDRILVLLLSTGIPLAVAGDGGPFGDLAAVDSELALLYRRLVGEEVSPFGKVRSPYFSAEGAARGFPEFRREDHDIYLVGRVSAAGVRSADRMSAGRVEPPGAGIFAFDLASQHRSLARAWLDSAQVILTRAGHQVEFQNTAAWAAPSRPLLGLAAEIPTVEATLPPVMTWSSGAVAILLGDTWSPQGCGGSEAAGLAGPAKLCVREIPAQLAKQGAAAILFQVGDPGNDGYPRPQVYFPAVLDGLSVIEAAYQASRYLSWRLVVEGDPLAVPFPRTGVGPREWVDELDPNTRLPQLFSGRRTEFLMRRYRTSRDAVTSLLAAEAEANRGRPETALQRLESVLDRDPQLGAALLLRAQLLEGMGRYEQAFFAYRRCLELGAGAEELVQGRLAEIAIDQLGDPSLAAPHAGWLFQRVGLRDLEVTRMWLEVKLGTGDLTEVESLSLRLVRGAERPPAFALEYLGRVYEARGDRTTAVRFYRRALERGPADRADWLNDKVAELENATSMNQPAAAAAVVVEDVPEAEGAETVATGDPSTIRARVVRRTPVESSRRAARAGGPVVLSLLIDERGQLLRVTPVSGPKELYRAAEAAVRQWTFAPKLVDGRPEVDSIEVSVDFGQSQRRR